MEMENQTENPTEKITISQTILNFIKGYELLYYIDYTMRALVDDGAMEGEEFKKYHEQFHVLRDVLKISNKYAMDEYQVDIMSFCSAVLDHKK